MMNDNLPGLVDIDALLERQEGFDCDFKRDVRGISSEDLVAFANSPPGGTILVGVDELNEPGQPQRGTVVGCRVGDAERMVILDKAQKCLPSVDVRVQVEIRDGVHFLRVTIPPSDHRPHCTANGTYKIRGDGRNLALEPGRLLGIFMQVEGTRFMGRFREATSRLEGHLGDANDVLAARLVDVVAELQVVQMQNSDEIRRTLDDLRATQERGSHYELDTAMQTQNVLERLQHDSREVMSTVRASVDSLRAELAEFRTYLWRRSE